MHHIIDSSDSNDKEQTRNASSFCAHRPAPFLNVAALQGYNYVPSPHFAHMSPLNHHILSPTSMKGHSPKAQTPTASLHDLLKSFDFDGLRRSNPFIYKLIQKQQKKLKEQKQIIEELRFQLQSYKDGEGASSKYNISVSTDTTMAEKRKGNFDNSYHTKDARPVIIKETVEDDIKADSDSNENNDSPCKRMKSETRLMAARSPYSISSASEA